MTMAALRALVVFDLTALIFLFATICLVCFWLVFSEPVGHDIEVWTGLYTLFWALAAFAATLCRGRVAVGPLVLPSIEAWLIPQGGDGAGRRQGPSRMETTGTVRGEVGAIGILGAFHGAAFIALLGSAMLIGDEEELLDRWPCIPLLASAVGAALGGLAFAWRGGQLREHVTEITSSAVSGRFPERVWTSKHYSAAWIGQP